MHRTNVGFNNHFVALREIPGIFRNDLYGSEDEKRRETKAPLGVTIRKTTSWLGPGMTKGS